MSVEYKNLSLASAEIKFDPGSGDFSGYAAVFGGVDSYGDTIHPGAFSKAVGDGSEVKMYFNHGWRKFELPIGKMLVRQDDRGLRVERADFTKGMQLADEVKLAMAHRTVDGLSIGYSLAADGFKTKSGNAGRDIYEVAFLKEVSVVDWPADRAALIDMKSAIEDAKALKDIEGLLRDAAGLSRAEATALVSRIKAISLGDQAGESKTSTDGAVAAILLHAHSLSLKGNK